MDYDLAIVGGGPAGLMAAVRAGRLGRRVLLLEKNRRPGVKILMAGGTRCNLTHDTDERGIVAAFGLNGRFLHSALAALGPREVVAFFRAEGVPTYVEPGGKVFPRSDRSADVLDALLRAAERTSCKLVGRAAVTDLQPLATGGFRIETADGQWTAGQVLLATGGCSYPSCGTTGDGYALAERFGHTIVTPRTALAPLVSPARWVIDLQGLTLPDVRVRVAPGAAAKGRQRVLAESRSSMLFTHFGLSGPAAMNVSRALSGPADARPSGIVCDFLPDVALPQWEPQFAEACRTSGRRQLSTMLAQWLPNRLADALVTQTLGDDGRAAELSKQNCRRLAEAVKQMHIPIDGTLGFKKAEVTAGGVALDEVDSSTLQSKRMPGLFLAGELLDLDGPIGGFNFQAAFSTGYVAGQGGKTPPG